MYTTDEQAAFAILAAFSVFFIIIGIISYVIFSWFMMKVFEKAGVQGKWRAWVPVYNQMVFAKLGDVNPWAVLIVWAATVVGSLIPFLGAIISFVGPLAIAALAVMAALRVQAKMGKDTVWIVLYIFLSIVWLGVLAFDKSRWNLAVGPAPWAQTAWLTDTTQWEGVPVQATTAPPYPAGGPYPPAPPTGGQYPPAPPEPPVVGGPEAPNPPSQPPQA